MRVSSLYTIAHSLVPIIIVVPILIIAMYMKSESHVDTFFYAGLVGLVAILSLSVGISWRMRVCQKDHLERKDERLQKIVEVRKGGEI